MTDNPSADHAQFLADLTASMASAVWIEEPGFPGGGRHVHIVERWEDLRGPRHGTVAVPRDLADYAGETANLDLEETVGPARVASDVIRLYARVITRGSIGDQAQILNPDLLIVNWTAHLTTPRVKELWESRFPQIRG